MPLIRRGPPTSPPASPTSAAQQGLLETGTVSERWAAARAMGQDASTVPLLAGALRLPQAPEVREAIFTSLVLIHTADAAAALASVIRSDDAQLRTGALDALGAMLDVAQPLLPALLGDPDPDVRLLACELVRPLEPRVGTELLCNMLESEQQPNVCGAAVDVLSETGLNSAVDVLRRCAVRFADEPYLGFAIADAIERTATRPASNG
jgi:HEAT repeat protein